MASLLPIAIVSTLQEQTTNTFHAKRQNLKDVLHFTRHTFRVTPVLEFQFQVQFFKNINFDLGSFLKISLGFGNGSY